MGRYEAMEHHHRILHDLQLLFGDWSRISSSTFRIPSPILPNRLGSILATRIHQLAAKVLLACNRFYISRLPSHRSDQFTVHLEERLEGSFSDLLHRCQAEG